MLGLKSVPRGRPDRIAYPLVCALAAAIAFAAPIASARDSDGVDDLLRTVKRSRIIDLSHTWDTSA